MRSFFKRQSNSHNRTAGSSPQISTSLSAPGAQTQGVPPPINFSRSLGAEQFAHPPQGGVAQQGNSTQQDDPGPFLGGFIRPQNSTLSTPSAVTRSSSVARPNGSSSQGPQAVQPDVDNDECYAWFFAVDQNGDGQLSPEELRNALLKEGGLRFSISTVKYLMGTFDLDGNGTIGFEEFKPLWNYITVWRRMFDAFDADRSGTIDAYELGNALAQYNLHVNAQTLDMLVKKYGITPPRNGYPGYPPPSPQIDLDNFICACILVRKMYELYDGCNAGRPGQPQLNKDEFLQAVIALP